MAGGRGIAFRFAAIAPTPSVHAVRFSPNAKTPLERGVFVSLCAMHVVCLGGASPLWTATSGTIRLSKGVGREPNLKEARDSVADEARDSTTGALDLTNRNRIQGRRAAGNRAVDRDAQYQRLPRAFGRCSKS
jgi:hypothetical protein